MTATGLVEPRRTGSAAPLSKLTQPAATTLEVRWSAASIAASLLVFALLLIAARPPYPTFDEQKYLGIATNLWGGRGLTTVFGATFTSHAPLWTVVLGAGHAIAGWDDLGWGRWLDAVAGLGVVTAGAWFAWRIRPAAGAIAAVGLVGVLYLHDQSRTARLDVPAAALGLAYIVIGCEAVRRASSGWAVAAGAVFAIGFLVEEGDLPFAPIPFLVGVLRSQPWPRLLPLSGWTLVAA